jgi:O-antigen/teichoic acid export membrane protein
MTLYHKINGFIQSPAFKSAGIYTFSNFFAKAIAFLLLFIYSNPAYISVNENGLLNLLSSAIFVLMPFLSMGTVQSTNVDFFKLGKEQFRDFFTTGFIIPTAVMLISIVVMFFFRHQLNAAYGFPLSFIFIIPFLTFLGFCNEQFVSIIRNNDDPVKYFKASMLRIAIEISLSVVLVVFFAWRWKGRVAGIMAANTVLFFMAYSYFRKKGYLFGKVKLQYIKEELIYAVPIIVMQFSTFCLSSSDKFFLSSFTNNDVVGVYGYASIFAAVVTIACSAVISYVMPKVYLCLSQSPVNFALLRKYFKVYALFSLLTLAGVIICTPVLYKFFINEKYHPGLKYMYLIATGYFFWSISYFFYSFLLYNKQKKKILLLSAISIGISLTGNYFFIRQWNAFGAAVSVCVSYFLVLIVTLLASYKNVCIIFMRNKMTGDQ